MLLLAGLLGCAPASPERGSWLGDGTAVATFDAHSDGAEPLEIQVIFPASSDGAPRGTSLPGAVLLADSGRGPDDYHALARALARSGFAVALPELPLGHASLDRQRAEVARALLRSDRGLLKGLVAEQVAVLGHGEGGVAAANQAIGGQFSALVLLAAAPDAGDAVEKLTVPSLVVAGLADSESPRAQLEDGWKRLPAPSLLAELGGVSHAQFTDDDRDDLAHCPPGLGLDAAHAQLANVVTLFLEFALKGDRGALQVLEQGGPNLSVEAK